MTLQLWGLDAPLAALCWGLAYASLMEITMMTEGPLLLLTSAVWLFTIASRLGNAAVAGRGWYVLFYRSHAAPMTIITLCVLAATLWMLFYYVGQIMLLYALVPAFVLVLGYLPILRRVPGLSGFFQAAAFALACSVPASFFSVIILPVELFFCAPTWYLAVLMFLYYLERSTWQAEEGDVPRSRRLLVQGGLILLFFFCLLSTGTAPFFERTLCETIAIGAACLWILIRLRPRLSKDSLFAIGWLVMALPAILGILIFATGGSH